MSTNRFLQGTQMHKNTIIRVIKNMQLLLAQLHVLTGLSVDCQKHRGGEKRLYWHLKNKI